MGQVLTINPLTATGPYDLSYFPLNPKVRRWDTIGEKGTRKANVADTPDQYIRLEDGVEIRFEAGNYNVGDYWLIPARAATADVEWPRDNSHNPIPQSKRGIHHYMCSLGLIKFVKANAQALTFEEDCRQFFSSLTDLIQFQYLSGDGQEALPGKELPQRLMVGLKLGNWPIGKAPLNLMKKYKVQFEALDKDGRVASSKAALSGTTPPPTNECIVDVIDGVASCAWRPKIASDR